MIRLLCVLAVVRALTDPGSPVLETLNSFGLAVLGSIGFNSYSILAFARLTYSVAHLWAARLASRLGHVVCASIAAILIFEIYQNYLRFSVVSLPQL